MPTSIELAKRMMELDKTLKKDLVSLVMKQEAYSRELEAKLDEAHDELREERIARMAADSCYRLTKLWWKQAQEKYHRAMWEYHSAMMKLSKQEVEAADKESKGE